MFQLTTIKPGSIRHTYIKNDAKLMGYLRMRYKDVHHESIKLFVDTSGWGEKLILADRLGRRTELQHWS